MIKKILIIIFLINVCSSGENCSCVINDLDILESFYNIKRLRIETPDGLHKYPITQLTVDCYSKAIYNSRKCRLCSGHNWSEFYECPIISCDRDDIKSPFILESSLSERNFYKTGEALAVYNFAPGKKICKYCLASGEWSKFADKQNCFKIIQSKKTCKYTDLINLEEKQLDFIRLHIQTPEGFKIDRKALQDDRIDSNTIIVYESYLKNLADIYQNKSTGSLRKKFCRYCENGFWSDIESCVELRCNKELLTGQPQLFLSDSTQKFNEKQIFFKPNTVLAIYYFGNDKFCKQCHENGEWSKYSLPDLCDLKSLKNNYKNQRDLYMKKLYKNEKTCLIKDQNFLYLISPNRKTLIQRSNITINSIIPSRSLIFHDLKNCSQCINGIWSVHNECNFNFCLKTDMENGLFKLNDFSIANNLQNIFVPGSIMLENNLSTSTKVCKICELVNGTTAQWSSNSQSVLCDPKKAYFTQNNLKDFPNFCKLNETIEKKGFILQFVISSSTKFYLIKDPVPESSMAIYVNENEKWCSKCINGVWESNFNLCPTEFSIKKCNPNQAFGSSYFVYTSDGMFLDESEKNQLVFPGEVISVYEFGMQKYCKECQINGLWSAFPRAEICNKINWIL